MCLGGVGGVNANECMFGLGLITVYAFTISKCRFADYEDITLTLTHTAQCNPFASPRLIGFTSNDIPNAHTALFTAYT